MMNDTARTHQHSTINIQHQAQPFAEHWAFAVQFILNSKYRPLLHNGETTRAFLIDIIIY